MKEYFFSIKTFFCLMVLAVSFDGHGQYTFSKRYFIDFSTFIQSIHLSENKYVIVSACNDSVGGVHIELGLTKIDDQGNVLEQNKIGEMDRDFWTVEDSYSEQNDLFVQTSLGSVNDTFSLSLTWFDSACDTLFTRFLRSPLYDSGNPNGTYINPQYSYLCSDSSIYLSHTFFDDDDTGTDAIFIKMDPQGNEVWRYAHPPSPSSQIIQSFIPHNGGVILGILDGANISDANQVIKKLNENGQEMWYLDSNDFIPGIGRLEDLIIDNDTLVVTGNSFDLEGNDMPYCSIYKVDTLGSLIWSNNYGEPDPVVSTYFTNLVQTTDGNYVAGGSWMTYPGSEAIPEGFTDEDIDYFAFVVKFDRNTGDIIWERKYRYLEIFWDRHDLSDMKATPDGGVIFCGESTDQLHVGDSIPYQHGWVVKLDACGCLVPGCDEACVVGLEETSSSSSLLKVGPNPASEFLNIFIANSPQIDIHSLSLVMHDMQGKLIYSTKVKNSETTYMLNTAAFADGQYVVSLLSKNEIIVSKSVVIDNH